MEAGREERQRKELVEDERRQTEIQQQAELFAQRQREFDRQTAIDRAEEARRDSAVVKGKLFGDAMRASAIRMGVDPIKAIPFFKNVEQLFDVYDVPVELRPVLVRPFLNDKAKAVVGKLSPEVLGDYERLKAAVLKEFKLSPNVYLNRFNTYRKVDSESYVAFASRLKVLLNKKTKIHARLGGIALKLDLEFWPRNADNLPVIVAP